MTKHILVCLATLGPLALMSSIALGADPVKVGVMDQQLVIERSKAGKRALDELKAYSATRQKIINSDDQELKELEQSIQEAKLSETAKQEKQKDVLEAFRDKVEAVVAKIAKRNGLQVVIDKGKGGPAIYGAEELDITTQVIEEFNKEYP